MKLSKKKIVIKFISSSHKFMNDEAFIGIAVLKSFTVAFNSIEKKI